MFKFETTKQSSSFYDENRTNIHGLHRAIRILESNGEAAIFDPLRNKIMPLPDDVIVYPNHGAGIACGKMMSKETTDTLGNQKKTNYALNPALTEDEFVTALLTGLTTPPGYFPKNVLINLNGYESLDRVLDRAQQPLTIEQFEYLALHEHALILDIRPAGDFAQGFIPGCINIGVEGNFAMWWEK